MESEIILFYILNAYRQVDLFQSDGMCCSVLKKRKPPKRPLHALYWSTVCLAV
jgi:hypothetical protein